MWRDSSSAVTAYVDLRYGDVMAGTIVETTQMRRVVNRYVSVYQDISLFAPAEVSVSLLPYLKCNENSCIFAAPCKNGEFKCANGYDVWMGPNDPCIDGYYTCDNNKDCSDGSDEAEDFCAGIFIALTFPSLTAFTLL